MERCEQRFYLADGQRGVGVSSCQIHQSEYLAREGVKLKSLLRSDFLSRVNFLMAIKLPLSKSFIENHSADATKKLTTLAKSGVKRVKLILIQCNVT